MTQLKIPETPPRSKSKTSSQPNPRSPERDQAKVATIDAYLALQKNSWTGLVPYGRYHLQNTAWRCPACIIVVFTPSPFGSKFVLLCPKHQTHQRGRGEEPETDPQKIRAALYRALLLLDGAGTLFIERQRGYGCLYYGEH